MKNRDKKGRFISNGESNPFNTKWIRRDAVVANETTKIDSDTEKEIYLTAFETARRLPKTYSANACYEAYLKHGKK